ncbi:MAG TPA: O-antigen ligase family protein [Paenibacillus sp.]|uniref:O-antigen ligase family protein n=2 Tax=Paenibacillus TaxID=44249 RepID=UPI002B6D073D|nr:O-antigen ligase family protein [Paenibacillus sp.]HUC92823.1 O-antigen ligase family protein [Paenibacillus sp.]
MAERQKSGDAGSGIASAAAIAVLLIVSALRYGMYFDVSFYRWETALLLAGAVSALYRFFWLIGLGRAAAGSDAGVAVPAAFGHTLAVWPLLLSALFVLGLAFEPASTLGTWNGALRWAAYAAFLHTLETWFHGGRSLRPLTAAIQAAAAFIVWGSLAGWLGWFRFPDFVMVSADERLTAVGARLNGYFQYANMSGAAFGTLLLLQLVWLAGKRRFGAGVMPRIAGLLAAPAMTALLLTESRGAWLAAAAGWAVGLFSLRQGGRRAWMLHSAWAVMAGAAGYRAVVRAAGTSWPAEGSGTGMPAVSETIVLVIVAAVALMGHELLRRLEEKKGLHSGFAGLLLTGVSSLSAVYVLYRTVGAEAAARITGRYETAAARRLFYEDGLALLRESPWTGYGGDAWRTLHRSIQSQPYVGNEVHSGYLDIALNIGLIGLLVLLLFIALIVIRVGRAERAGLAPISVLLLHPAVDLDMSFGFYWLLLLSLAVRFGGRGDNGAGAAEGGGIVTAAAHGVGTAAADDASFGWARLARPGNVRVEASDARSGGLAAEKVDARQPPRAARAAGAVRAAAALLAAALLCTAAAAAWRLDRARAAREAAAAAQGAARGHALREALEANPAWTRIRLELAPLAPPRERAALLAAGLRYEPQSVPLLWELGRNAAELGDERRAAAYMRLALERDRFDKAKQTEAVAMLARLAEAKLAAGDSGRAREAAQSALALYARYEELVRAVRAMDNPANGRRFGMTLEAEQAAGDCRRLLSSLVEAEN